MTEIKVAVDTLVAHAQERYEDAYVCDGARRFIKFVGNVPDAAFGELPWSGQWKKDWATARDARFTEATTLRDVLADTAGGLYQVAADYTDADITSAMDLDVQSTELAAFVPNPTKNNNHTYHPGAGKDYYKPPAAPIDGKYTPNAPRDSRLYYVIHSAIIGMPRIEAPDTISDTDRAEMHYGDSEGKKALTTFLNEHGETLRKVESIVRSFSPAIAKPMEDQIDVAWQAWPKILWERADLFHALAKSYKEMRDEYSGETKRLQAYWYSPGAAAAYFDHANVLLKYFDDLEKEAAWLAEEGKKCANLIDRLQLTYANIGYQHIKNILDHYEAYLDEMNDMTKSDDPLKLLAEAFNAFAKEIIRTEKTSATQAEQMLQLSQTVMDHKPDLGTAAHTAVPFPQIEGGDTWKDGDGWKPEENPRPAPVN